MQEIHESFTEVKEQIVILQFIIGNLSNNFFVVEIYPIHFNKLYENNDNLCRAKTTIVLENE